LTLLAGFEAGRQSGSFPGTDASLARAVTLTGVNIISGGINHV
jgi:hypothetical protein